jgi:hypothetical protein
MDEVIFKNDIDNKVNFYKQSEINNAGNEIDKEFSERIAKQQSLVNQKAYDWNLALTDAKKEADGTGGSRQKQVGKIALLKLGVASRLQSDYNAENLKLTTLTADYNIAKENAKNRAKDGFIGNALLVRIRAMFDLISEDKFMLGVYLLFTLFLFCLEFLVVLIKIGSKNSIDEDLEKARETLLRAKTKKTLDRYELYYQPQDFNLSVKNANQIANQNVTSIF